jgi:hypothetical protein
MKLHARCEYEIDLSWMVQFDYLKGGSCGLLVCGEDEIRKLLGESSMWDWNLNWG